jgi:uncharacterized repeat protein (TIGR02543 family)
MAACTVTYNGNGSTGGTVPVDGLSPYAGPQTITLLTNSGSLVKTGYVFRGWNTSATYLLNCWQPGDHYPLTANTTFYAEWQLPTQAVAGAVDVYDSPGNDPAGNPLTGLAPLGSTIAGTMVSVAGAIVGPRPYRMRGKNGAGDFVEWLAPSIDGSGAFAGVAVTDVVLISIGPILAH